MQPLFFDFPADQAAYTIADEWLLGDSLLAAPVLAAGTSRDVHLPPGGGTTSRITGICTGPTDLHGYAAGLGTTPEFVRLATAQSGRLMSDLR